MTDQEIVEFAQRFESFCTANGLAYLVVLTQQGSEQVHAGIGAHDLHSCFTVVYCALQRAHDGFAADGKTRPMEIMRECLTVLDRYVRTEPPRIDLH